MKGRDRVKKRTFPRAKDRALPGCAGRRNDPSLRRLFVLALACTYVVPGYAQVRPDTSDAPIDTLQVISEMQPPAGPVLPRAGFPSDSGGFAVGEAPLARLPLLEVTDLLARVPGAFVYAFGAPGWPDAWSLYGLAPQQATLLWNELPFDDPLTGRPQYDLLPFTMLEPLRVQSARYGSPVALYASTRPFDSPVPYTELLYQKGADGLQGVSAVHTQHRRRKLWGQKGVLGLLGGYVGRAAQGEYPGSRLRRERKVYGRLRYEQVNWSVELGNLHNRRLVGAHGGVIPRGGNFDSVYERFGAIVRNGNARRQTIRNDLYLRINTRLIRGLAEPLSVMAYWTAQTFRYRTAPQPYEAKTHRYGFSGRQDLPLGAHRFQLQLEGWVDHLRESNALPDSLGLAHNQLHLTLRDTLNFRQTSVMLEGSLHRGAGSDSPGGAVRAARRFGGAAIFAEASYAGRPVSWIEQYGFGGFVRPLEAPVSGRVLHGRLGLSAAAGAFDVLLFGFAGGQTDAIDYYASVEDTDGVGDTMQVLVSGSPLQQIGVAADLGWRRTAGTGLYATVQPTWIRIRPSETFAGSNLLASNLPQIFVNGRLGARFLLFQGDLDLDVYVQGRFWTEMTSRTLHPPTGLLILPEPEGRIFGPSGTLDLFVEAQVRTATLFLVYENVLSGSALQPGTLIVPVYPLPERRFRFGVFWPIKN